jgi:hypothetical protein
MTDTNTHQAWDRFQTDMKTLAGELRRHYKNSDDEEKAAEINRSLQQLGQAAEAFFESLDTATRDPEVEQARSAPRDRLVPRWRGRFAR